MPTGIATGMTSVTGMNTGISPFGAPSPPPQRNNMFISNNINPLGTQGLIGMSKPHPPSSRTNVLASAINSGLPINSYNTLGNNNTVNTGGRMNHMTPFGSNC